MSTSLIRNKFNTILFCRGSKASKTDNISAKQAPCVKEKHRAYRGISETSDTQPKGL